ncbi:hypothetical protein VHEMI02737 [[Torrubiella] hemipterigena]|uniref:Uncharacterized protein n=1 Tax=[Torrubiella] hemipterigena TaxID=1531966 RepID=A0A0A1SQL4_9HYPO|nr:hypothetical protein VHEMI02737 [[Torrubiella] hemipterigena]
MLQGTIYELLTHPNPVLDTRQQVKGPVTRNTEYVKLERENVSIWHDFTFENIEAAYSHLFSIGPIQSEAVHPYPRGSPSEIRTEDSVDKISYYWNALVCRYPFKIGCERLQTALGLVRTDVSMAKGELPSPPLDGGRDMHPDWSIYLRDERRTILVWGDSKCSSKWSSTNTRSDNWIWPFRQLATYCVNDSTRYGYVITPDELVALRVIMDPISRCGYRLEYRAIPWSQHGPHVLTVNLAIWALAMMSVNDGHRSIAPQDWTLPLNIWWQDINRRTGQVSYEHHLSARTAQQLPPGAIAHQRPTALPPQYIPEEPQTVRRSTRNRR